MDRWFAKKHIKKKKVGRGITQNVVGLGPRTRRDSLNRLLGEYYTRYFYGQLGPTMSQYQSVQYHKVK